MFEQAVFPVQNEAEYRQLHGRVATAFSGTRVDLFLAAVKAHRLRIRQFEQILAAGLLGEDGSRLYAGLPVSDQALMREFYLAQVERVPAELRARFSGIYAYY